MRRGFGVTESGESGETESTVKQKTNAPVETGSRHVGQLVIGDDGLAVVLIASAMQAWQYTCPGMATLTLTLKLRKPEGYTYRRGELQVT